LIGCHVMESETAIEQQFDAFVQKLSNASVSDSAPKDDQAWAASMSEAFTPNREHLVYYAKAIQHGVDLCFIAAAYNLPSVQAFHLSDQIDDITSTLEENDLITRIITTDNAQANESCVRSKLDMKASEFIPADVLEKHGLDGDFNVAFKHPTNDKSIFFVSDPPHALKKVGSALEHRELYWDGCPMTMTMLYEVWESINSQQGVGTLTAYCKFTMDHYFGSRWKAMNVKRTAQIFSNTKCQMIDAVCDEPDKYPMRSCPPGSDRKPLFSKVRELCGLTFATGRTQRIRLRKRLQRMDGSMLMSFLEY
jgi:hypothetical protein